MDSLLDSPGDVRTWLLTLFGVPAVMIVTINTLLVCAEWLKVGRSAGRATSTVGRWITSISRDGWSAAGPARRAALTLLALALGQAVAVALLYLTCRMLYSLPPAIQPSEGPGGPVWSAFVASVISPPTEDPPWTLYVFLVAVAVAGTFDAALVLRAKNLYVVARTALTAFVVPLWLVMFVVGGLCLLVLIGVGALHLAAAVSGADTTGPSWLVGLALGVATGGVAYLTTLTGGMFTLKMSDLLDPDDELLPTRATRR